MSYDLLQIRRKPILPEDLLIATSISILFKTSKNINKREIQVDFNYLK